MATMNVSIVTPERVAYESDDVEIINVRTIDGNRGIMPNHEPLITGLNIGIIRVKDGSGEDIFSATQGYMEVKPDEVTVLVGSAEHSEEIDVDRALAAKEEAEERLEKKHEDHIDERQAEIALEKALNRLQASKHHDFDQFE
ncbi:F0F1 ATP synthase subunit epsilon [Halanaerobacter jeridensis]|uniref:ATP synthase epsilon chain n=1 Tax=Halanaerobacter jeridensis TaxID=706427 RepID=A0A938XPR2_9FIRM|nr:F0F1 ATP synthase subunit epsilon [Halanaerobacter jeridensis]MBM7557007.1 F-type H+-transporting ATPase subunit epsilon [Halanaerobacter jeridensis]